MIYAHSSLNEGLEMNSTELWVQKFEEQLNCVSCRQYKEVKVYKDTGELLDVHALPIQDIIHNLQHIDVWCDECTVRNMYRIRTPGRMKRKEEAAEAASLYRNPWHDTSSKEQVLSRGVVVTKKDFLSCAKDDSCSHCGGKFHESIMEFHKASGKHESIQKLVSNASSVDKLIAEMEQSILVCANCHRLLHSGCFYLPLPLWSYEKNKKRILSSISYKEN